jgi:hypothetical protein
MRRNVPITRKKEQEIIAALEKDSHASRVARTLGDVSYATVWRIADRAEKPWAARVYRRKCGRKSRGRWPLNPG